MRIQRSYLAVPGATPDLFPKAARSGADHVFLDLEDAVSPDDKEAARPIVVAGVNEVDWGSQSISIRVNSPTSTFLPGDISSVLAGTAGRLDTILVPKVESAGELAEIERMLGDADIGIEVLIETAAAFVNLSDIAACGGRLEALHFGAGDFAASMGSRATEIGEDDPSFGGDQWLAVRTAIVAAARANGLNAVDSAYGNFGDADGYRASARRAAALGFDGKWAIHPSQVPIANDVFSPTDDEVRRAAQILDALRRAAADGRGAVQIDGVMIDAASIRMAENVMAIDQRVRNQSTSP